MKLKFELVNGYGVLVNEEAEIKEGDIALQNNRILRTIVGDNHSASKGTYHYKFANKEGWSKVIFAEPELKLEDVPVFNWRDFEVKKLAEKECEKAFKNSNNPSQFRSDLFCKYFIQGYKSNSVRFTEEDLINAIWFGRSQGYNYASQETYLDSCELAEISKEQKDDLEVYIKSLQKYPKYVGMETEIVDFAAPDRVDYNYKLFTNLEGKQEGIVKELIWT